VDGPDAPILPEALTRTERWLWRHRRAVTVVVVALIAVDESAAYGTRARQWDWLLVSGALLYLALVPTSLTEPQRVTQAVSRLQARSALSPPLKEAAVLPALHRRANRAAAWGGWLSMPAALGAWYWAYSTDLPRHIVLALVEVIAAVPIGRFVGRAIAYSSLGRELQRHGVEVRVTPGHVDGAGGLRPVGDLFLFHASMVAAVAAYLGIWWLITPGYFPRYGSWRDTYLGLLGAMLVCEVLAFVAPMLWFHGRMLSTKRSLLVAEADPLSHRASLLEGEILSAAPSDRPAMRDELALLNSRYAAIESLPTWPVSPSMRRQFAVRNVLLVAPIVVDALSAQSSWHGILDQLAKVVAAR
jgi:hypothetical protein